MKKAIILILLIIFLFCSCSNANAGGQDIVLDDTYGNENYQNIELSEKITFIKPVSGKITSPFGERINPITHINSFHTGVDIGVDEGTKIACASGGIVEEVGTNNAYGNYILVTHSENYQTYYAHCKQINVEVGTVIRQGEIIAISGNTGTYTTGPHLHFEIRYNKKPINPTSCYDGVIDAF